GGGRGFGCAFVPGPCVQPAAERTVTTPGSSTRSRRTRWWGGWMGCQSGAGVALGRAGVGGREGAGAGAAEGAVGPLVVVAAHGVELALHLPSQRSTSLRAARANRRPVRPCAHSRDLHHTC